MIPRISLALGISVRKMGRGVQPSAQARSGAQLSVTWRGASPGGGSRGPRAALIALSLRRPAQTGSHDNPASRHPGAAARVTSGPFASGSETPPRPRPSGPQSGVRRLLGSLVGPRRLRRRHRRRPGASASPGPSAQPRPGPPLDPPPRDVTPWLSASGSRRARGPGRGAL